MSPREECREQEEEEKGGEELDREIQRWEVVKAIEKQRNGKAGGVDCAGWCLEGKRYRWRG